MAEHVIVKLTLDDSSVKSAIERAAAAVDSAYRQRRDIAIFFFVVGFVSCLLLRLVVGLL